MERRKGQFRLQQCRESKEQHKTEATQGQFRGFQSQKIRHITIQNFLVRVSMERKFNPEPKASWLDTAKK